MFFNLSLHRSATTSTAQVFRDCGLTTCDWVGWNFEQRHQGNFKRGREYELTEAIMTSFPNRDYYGDLPVPLLHTELANRYPGAHYFMVLRDVDTWAESSFQHCIYTGERAENPSIENITPANRMMLEYYDLYERAKISLSKGTLQKQHDCTWRLLFHRHLISVHNALSAKGIRLQLFYLSDPELGPKLMRFANPLMDIQDAKEYSMAQRHSTDRGRDPNSEDPDF